MKWLTLSILTLLILGTPVLADAATIRSNNTIEINKEEIISGNLYIAGGKVTVDGTVEGDLSIAAGDIFLNGTVQDDVVIFGGDINVSGIVNGDLRVVGGDINVSGQITGDLVLIGGHVNVLPEANVTGDIILAGGTITINDINSAHLRAIGANIKLKGNIEGDAAITTQRLDLEDGAKISGTLNYFSPHEFNEGKNVNLSGKVNFNKVNSLQENGVIQQALLSFLNFWILLRFITTLLLTFLLVYIFKVFSQKTAEYTIKSFFSSFIIGFLVTILMPIVVLISFISLILIPISLLLTLAYIFFFIISTAVSGIAVGALVKRAFSKEDVLEVTFATAALGVVILTLLQFVPVVGEITRLIFFFAAFGAVWRQVYTQIRWGDLILFKTKK